jgi:hypothetical protein
MQTLSVDGKEGQSSKGTHWVANNIKQGAKEVNLQVKVIYHTVTFHKHKL